MGLQREVVGKRLRQAEAEREQLYLVPVAVANTAHHLCAHIAQSNPGGHIVNKRGGPLTSLLGLRQQCGRGSRLPQGEHTLLDELRPRGGFIPAETLALAGNAGDNGTAGGTLHQPELDFLVG